MLHNKATIEKGKRGFDVVMIEHDARPLATASLYQPLEEARALVSSLGKKELYIFVGFGSGYVFAEIKNRYPQAKIIVFEPVIEVIQLIEHEASLINRAKGLIVIPSLHYEAVRQGVRSHFLPHTDFTLHVGISANYEKILGVNCQTIMQAIEEGIHDQIGDYQTQAAFAKVWLRNIAKNADFLKDAPADLGTLKKHKRALVLGAGPSANDLVKRLRKLSEVDVYSTDTAFGASQAYGIKPVAVGVIDPQIHSRWHLAPWLNHQSCIIAPLSAYIHNANLSFAHFIASKHPLLQAIGSHSRNFTSLDTNAGNIGAFLVRLAIELGYEEVETVGLDFSYAAKNPYVLPSYFDAEFMARSSRTLPLVQLYSQLYLDEGIFDGPLIRTERLDSYRSLFIEELTFLGLDFAEETRGNFVIKNRSKPRILPQISKKDFCKGVFEVYEKLKSDPEVKYQETLGLCLPNLAQKQRERLQKNEKTVDTFESDVKSAYAEVCLFSQKLYEGLSYGR